MQKWVHIRLFSQKEESTAGPTSEMRGLKNLKNPGFQKWEPFLLGGQSLSG